MDFVDEDMRGSRFERVHLGGTTFDGINLEDARFNGVLMNRVVMRGVEMLDLDISGGIHKLVVNGVDVGPLVDAELNKRYPDRIKMRPADPDGFRHAWEILERLWEDTVGRARELDPELLHESVDGEWSFIETLRHLVFATDAWIRRGILGDPTPWHPLDLPWDEMPDMPGIPRDRTARPTLDEVLALRHDRMGTVRELLAGLTDEQLAADTVPVLEPPGWPESRSYPVAQCLRVILNEEWEHHLYAERDLDALTKRPT